MIKTLRRKLIAAAMFSLAVVLLIILGGVNLMSYQKVAADADAVLAVLSANGGTFPKPKGQAVYPEDGEPPRTLPGGDKRGYGGRGMSPETPYESRYFSVQVNQEGQVVQSDTGQIAAIDEESAEDYALKVWHWGKTSGFLGNYRFIRWEEEGISHIVFLDCRQGLSGFRATLLASAALALVGLAAVLILLLILSGRIVRPVAESYEKQKRFITDAGHELKTPLAIISADTDLAEMECGENQWLEDIRRQARRLTDLTNDLIYLSRMEEEQPRLQLIEFPLSDVAEEAAQSFAALAKNQGKVLDIHIHPMLSFTGDEKAIRQLLSILLDNALKYSSEGDVLALSLEHQGRSLLLSVSNPTQQPLDRGSLDQLFDRFYRADQSRSSQTGGYGLGLSIAKSIVAAHKGRIRAESRDGRRLTIVVSLPT